MCGNPLRSGACAFIWFTFALSLPAAPSPVVDLGYAQYSGKQTYPNAIAYLGIPYAEPPIGDLRFRAPVPLNTTRVTEGSGGNPYKVTTYPNFCIQGPVGGQCDISPYAYLLKIHENVLFSWR